MSLTVDEIEALSAKASEVLGCYVTFGTNKNKDWYAARQTPAYEFHSGTLPEVIAKLREWAAPPKPATLTITVPFSWAEARAGGPSMQLGDIDKVSKACREAIKPWTNS